VDRATEIAHSTVRQHASQIDVESRFPVENFEALGGAGLLGYFIPPALGGIGGDIMTFRRIAQVLGGECLSTALTWVMHAHQVAVLADHRSPQHESALEEIARDRKLLASVTTEFGKGGDILRAEAPLEPMDGDRWRLRRSAPVVSYGEQAEFYLVTMRAGEDRPTTDARLVLVRRGDGDIQVTGGWDAMGLRGTMSVPMEFDVEVPQDRAVGETFRHAALMTLIPAAQIGWTAAWFGAAREALRRFVRVQRSRQSEAFRSDLFLTRLADLRLSLDLTESLLDRMARQLDEMRDRGADLREYEEISYNLLINNLKIAGSRLSFSVVDGLIELGGMSYGYLRNDDAGLERVFRDLRSAALMFSNDRLLQANGRLILVEELPIHRIWRG